MSTITLKEAQIGIFCEANAGRSQMAETMLRDRISESNIAVPVFSAGLKDYTGEYTHPHPDVIKEMEGRGFDISHQTVKHANKNMITPNTIAVILTNPDLLEKHPYIEEKAYAILLAESTDPSLDLENTLTPLTTDIYYIVWLLHYALTNKFDQIGKRGADGKAVPQTLSLPLFGPPAIEEKYSRFRLPQNI